jgi:hypothetical protein
VDSSPRRTSLSGTINGDLGASASAKSLSRDLLVWFTRLPVGGYEKHAEGPPMEYVISSPLSSSEIG